MCWDKALSVTDVARAAAVSDLGLGQLDLMENPSNLPKTGSNSIRDKLNPIQGRKRDKITDGAGC